MRTTFRSGFSWWLKSSLLFVASFSIGAAGTAAGDHEFAGLLNRADKLMDKQKAGEALPLYSKAVKLRPHNSEAHARFGWVLFALGKADKGLKEELKAVSLDPKNTVAHHNLGVMYLTLNQPAKAADEFRLEYKIDPKRNCHCGSVKSLLMAYPPASK